MRPDLHTSLKINDTLCGNEGGWDKLRTANSNSLQPFLPSERVVQPEKVDQPERVVQPEKVDNSGKVEKQVKKFFAKTMVRPSVIQFSVSAIPGLPKKTLPTGKGRKRKTAPHSKDINPPKKVGKYQDHNLALSRIRALPGLSVTRVSAPQSEETEKVSETEESVWGLAWDSKSNSFETKVTVSLMGNKLCDVIENNKK